MTRVLIIDDEAAVQHTLADMLEMGGHTAILAGQGKQVLEDIRREAYDVVLTDLNMPEITGWNVAQWVRERRPGTPIIAISGAYGGELDAGWLTQFVAVLEKPVRRAELLAAVAAAVPPPIP